MTAWAHLENIVIIVSVSVLVWFGHLWGLLLMLALNDTPSTNNTKEESKR